MLANGFGMTSLVMILFAVLGLRTVYALPVAIHVLPDERYGSSAEDIDIFGVQVSLNASSASAPADPPAVHTLKDLYDGNVKFRNHESSRQIRTNTTQSMQVNTSVVYNCTHQKCHSTYLYVPWMFGQSVRFPVTQCLQQVFSRSYLCLVTDQKVSSTRHQGPPSRIPILQTNTNRKTPACKPDRALIFKNGTY